MVGKEDKRDLLPPQVIYHRKKIGCHAKVSFSTDWDITDSDNHWSTEVTMLTYLDNVVIPYFAEARRDLELADDHVALAIFDVFCSTLL